MVMEQLDVHVRQNEHGPHFTSTRPIDLSVKPKTINLGEKIGQNLCDLALGIKIS